MPFQLLCDYPTPACMLSRMPLTLEELSVLHFRPLPISSPLPPNKGIKGKTSLIVKSKCILEKLTFAPFICASLYATNNSSFILVLFMRFLLHVSVCGVD